MSQSSSTDRVEFVRLNGETIRVTSWTEPIPGTYRLVAIVRGTGDARVLSELLDHPTLELEIPGLPSMSVIVADIDRRETGNPPAVITRFAVDFRSGEEMPVPQPPTLEERVAALEGEVAALQRLVRTMANNSQT
jgi:hypothetical protein